MFCRQCGNTIPDDSFFCQKCGATQYDDIQLANKEVEMKEEIDEQAVNSANKADEINENINNTNDAVSASIEVEYRVSASVNIAIHKLFHFTKISYKYCQ